MPFNEGNEQGDYIFTRDKKLKESRKKTNHRMVPSISGKRNTEEVLEKSAELSDHMNSTNNDVDPMDKNFKEDNLELETDKSFQLDMDDKKAVGKFILENIKNNNASFSTQERNECIQFLKDQEAYRHVKFITSCALAFTMGVMVSKYILKTRYED